MVAYRPTLAGSERVIWSLTSDRPNQILPAEMFNKSYTTTSNHHHHQKITAISPGRGRRRPWCPRRRRAWRARRGRRGGSHGRADGRNLDNEGETRRGLTTGVEESVDGKLKRSRAAARCRFLAKSARPPSRALNRVERRV
jgi:hypothetical protein